MKLPEETNQENIRSKILCLSCIHKKVDYEGNNYCEIVNQIPKEIINGFTAQCSFYCAEEK